MRAPVSRIPPTAAPTPTPALAPVDNPEDDDDTDDEVGEALGPEVCAPPLAFCVVSPVAVDCGKEEPGLVAGALVDGAGFAVERLMSTFWKGAAR